MTGDQSSLWAVRKGTLEMLELPQSQIGKILHALRLKGGVICGFCDRNGLGIRDCGCCCGGGKKFCGSGKVDRGCSGIVLRVSIAVISWSV